MNALPVLPRYQLAFQRGGMQIAIPASRSWFSILFLGLWLCFWAAGEINVVGHLANPGRAPEPLLYLWLAGWSAGGVSVMTTILWQLFGEELLLVDAASITYRVQLFGLGRTRRYLASQITHMRAVDIPAPRFGRRAALKLPFFGCVAGPIAFDYGASEIMVGPSLSGAEARLLVPHLKQQLPAGAFA